MISPKNTAKCALFLFLLLVTASCKKSYKTISELNEYLNNADNGCSLTKTINKIDVTVKYLPSSYLVLKSLQSKIDDVSLLDKSILADSLLKAQDNFLTFIMTISPQLNKDSKSDATPIMYNGIEDEIGYVERVFSMNFSLEQHIRLYNGKQEIKPIAAFVENVYELSDGRNFMITFPRHEIKRLGEMQEISFVFTDPYFNVGTLQFHFNTEDIIDANKLKVPWDNI